MLLSMQGGSGALRLAVVGRGEDFHHPGSSHTRARWRLERWSSTTGARIRHERFRSRAPSELTSAMATEDALEGADVGRALGHEGARELKARRTIALREKHSSVSAWSLTSASSPQR